MGRKTVLQWKHARPEVDGLLNHSDSPCWQPNTDICEDGGRLLIRMELAGIGADEVDLHLADNTLVVSGFRGDKACSKKDSAFSFHQLEIEYGPFRKVLRLPYPVDPRRATAVMRAGLLQIELPRRRTVRRRAVHIEVDG